MSDKKELIEEYFDGETSSERKAELRMLLDGDNSDERILMDLEEAFKMEDDVSQLKSRLQKLDEPKRRSGFRLKIAASVALILSASLLIFKLVDSSKSNTTDELFISFYQPYDGVVTARGEASRLTHGMTLYNDRKYEEALAFFLNLEQKEISDGQLRLLISSCYLGLNLPDKSIQQLSEGFDDESTLLLSNRTWYVALSYLKKGEIDMCARLLKDLIDTQSPYKKQASELFSELN